MPISFMSHPERKELLSRATGEHNEVLQEQMAAINYIGFLKLGYTQKVHSA